MEITQSIHAALLVSDLKKAQHFYGQILGLSKVDRPLNFPGTWYQVGNFQIHLIVSSEIIPDIVNPEKLGRNRHLAFSIIDLEKAKTKLLANNCPIQGSASGRAALFTQDPDGNIIELNQK
ncbi:MAG: VOC family protein [Trichodesmium sp. St16_bin4-tuft]|uniref:Glyoxalase/bleomycin resistance protein/dioxygenase n=1 Tax=Trichodesmium erythraeum (strain IMS101) TaxID=203124 RepID=Q10YW3_TRIEI|nr:VOC family protein [Trichodesmium erythraeum GBRTRLIN201]MDE5098789.1 VOC family protein [Trichodesmium sp. St16_bin4-tuft]